MKKSELASALASKAGLSKAEANSVLNALEELVAESLSRGDKVQWTGFGTWSVRHRAARKGVNPSTGQEIQIPAKKVPAFKASSAFSKKF